jgi:type II secretory pathway pseudopilin PulG
MRVKGSGGYSLVEIGIAMAILGGVSLLTMRIVQEQKGNEAFIKARTEIQNAISVLRTTLSDSENCRAILSGRTFQKPDNGSEGEEIEALLLPLRGQTDGNGNAIGKEFLKKNQNYKDFTVKSIHLSGDTTITPGASPQQQTGKLVIKFEIKNRSLSRWSRANSNQGISQSIPISGTVGANSVKLSDCGLTVSEANTIAKEKFCKSLGNAATWDPSTKKCTFSANMTCPEGEVMVKMNSLGGIVCEPIKDAIKLEDLFSTSSCLSTGKFRIVEENGKLRIDCPQ